MARVIAGNMMFKLHDLSDFTSIRQNSFSKVQRKFDLIKSLIEIKEMMKVKADIKSLQFIFNFDGVDKGIQIDSSSSSLPKQVIGDQQRFKQVTLNFIENAIANTFEGFVKISIKYNFQKQHIFLTCKDSGIGIDQDKQQQLFQKLNPIERLNNLKNKLEQEDSTDNQNIGLGLNICRDILKRYNGSINLDSTFDVGSTFSFNMELENAESEE